MTALPKPQTNFVETISSLVLSSSGKDSDFPLRIRVPIPQDARELKNHLTSAGIAWNSHHSELELLLAEKCASDAIVAYLLSHKYVPRFDYSHFASHPGMLYVTGILLKDRDVGEFFNQKSAHRLLSDVKRNGHEAVLRFDNYIDADVIAQANFSPNPLGKNLHVHRYKKGHEIRPVEPVLDDSVVYDTIVIENFSDFAGASSLDQLGAILDRFRLFLPVSEVFFPITHDADRIRFKRVGFVGLAPHRDVSSRVLRALYYLNDRTLPEILAFSQSDIYDVTNDVNVPEPVLSPEGPRLKLSIAQRKHNHHLHETEQFVRLENGTLSVSDAVELLAPRFTKSANYQETNVYVNNFPIMFGNDDELWGKFWNQFGVGRVKSAKIIKPQFYLKKPDGALGKIGFVFYEEFRMALRAILLTNNKVVRYQDGPAILIQASFAIQKHTHQPQKQKYHSYNYYAESAPKYNGGSYVPVPEYIPLEMVPQEYIPQVPPEHMHPPEYMMPYMVSMPVMDRPDPHEFRRDDMGGYHPYGFYYPFFPYSQVPMNPMMPPPGPERKKSA